MKSLKQTLNESFNQVNESLSYDEMMDILDIAAQYSSDAHDAANIVWSNKKSLIDYLASDKIERADRKEFLQQVSESFNQVNDSKLKDEFRPEF